ncbi:hypothetical protein OAO01_02720 [Oligoflexia bacterium]|nr:hypothetical protein [Oligoflexia bacterium]
MYVRDTKDSRGIVLISAALLIAILIGGFVALALDISLMVSSRQMFQNMSDNFSLAFTERYLSALQEQEHAGNALTDTVMVTVVKDAAERAWKVMDANEFVMEWRLENPEAFPGVINIADLDVTIPESGAASTRPLMGEIVLGKVHFAPDEPDTTGCAGYPCFQKKAVTDPENNGVEVHLDLSSTNPIRTIFAHLLGFSHQTLSTKSNASIFAMNAFFAVDISPSMTWEGNDYRIFGIPKPNIGFSPPPPATPVPVWQLADTYPDVDSRIVGQMTPTPDDPGPNADMCGAINWWTAATWSTACDPSGFKSKWHPCCSHPGTRTPYSMKLKDEFTIAGECDGELLPAWSSDESNVCFKSHEDLSWNTYSDYCAIENRRNAHLFRMTPHAPLFEGNFRPLWAEVGELLTEAYNEYDYDVSNLNYQNTRYARSVSPGFDNAGQGSEYKACYLIDYRNDSVTNIQENQATPQPLFYVLQGISDSMGDLMMGGFRQSNIGVAAFDHNIYAGQLDEFDMPTASGRFLPMGKKGGDEFHRLKVALDVNSKDWVLGGLDPPDYISLGWVPFDNAFSDISRVLSAALQQYSNIAADRDAVHHIVLVTDGESNCDGAGCQNRGTKVIKSLYYIANIANKLITDRIAVTTILLGKHSGGHYLVRASKLGKGCMSYQEALNTSELVVNDSIDEYVTITGSGYTIDEPKADRDFAKRFEGKPFYVPNILAFLSQVTRGHWCPLLDCLQDGAGNCVPFYDAMNARCDVAKGVGWYNPIPAPYILIENPPGSGNDVAVTDDKGRILFDPLGRSREKQFRDCLSTILTWPIKLFRPFYPSSAGGNPTPPPDSGG